MQLFASGQARICDTRIGFELHYSQTRNANHISCQCIESLVFFSFFSFEMCYLSIQDSVSSSQFHHFTHIWILIILLYPSCPADIFHAHAHTHTSAKLFDFIRFSKHYSSWFGRLHPSISAGLSGNSGSLGSPGATNK